MPKQKPKTLMVVPAPGLIVRDPGTGRPLPKEGGKVVRSAYWLRRLAQGDVTVAKPAAAAPKKQEPVKSSGTDKKE